MSSAGAILMKYEALRSKAFGAITAAYTPVGSSFLNPIRIIKITNATDANVLISFDGLIDHDIIAANSAQVLDYASNKSSQGGNAEQQAATIVFVKREAGAPGSGNLYVTCIYADTV